MNLSLKTKAARRSDGKRHGHARHGAVTPEYYVWRGMIKRCTTPSHKSWMLYGGRGISVCPQWLESFEAFLADMGERPFAKAQIDRIDNNSGYSPENCRWTTVTVNARNRRNNFRITAWGETRCVSEWAEMLGLTPASLRERLQNGWSAEDVVSTPSTTRQKGNNPGSIHGISKLDEAQVLQIRARYADGSVQRSLAREFGVCAQTINNIVHRKGWTHI